MIPIFTIVVVSPALYGNTLQTPQPIKPKKNSCLNSFLIILKFFLREIKLKKNNIKNTSDHLQNDNEIGGTNSTPPLATTKFVAIKIGWINRSEYGIKIELVFFNSKYF